MREYLRQFRKNLRREALGRALRRAYPTFVLLLFVLASLVIGYVLLWHLPTRAASSLTEESDLVRRTVENEYRATGAQLFLGLGILVGIYLTYRRIRAAERQVAAAEQGQITERFTRAIEQLGKSGEDGLALRLGGIYALERIMVDSPADARTVQEVLSAFIREQTALSENAIPEKRRSRPSTDTQAAVTVLGRAHLANLGLSANLRGVDLKGVALQSADLREFDFEMAHLEEADLEKACLDRSNLRKAHLQGANLWAASLESAKMEVANLQKAMLWRANLRNANLSAAHLEGATLIEAALDGAHLTRADLTGAALSDSQLVGARLMGAKLTGADLKQANLEGANLSQSQLTNAKLVGAKLSGANLTRASLEGADLTDVVGLTRQQLEAASIDKSTVLPAGFRGRLTGKDGAGT